MAIVTGALTDFQGLPRPDLNPRIVFSPSGPAGRNASVFFSHDIKVTPAPTGEFTVGLIDTETVAPGDFHYKVRIEWLDADGNFIEADFFPWEMRVPAAGGRVADLLRMPRNALEVWVGETDDPTYKFWYQPSTALLRR